MKFRNSILAGLSANPDRIAIRTLDGQGRIREYRYSEVQARVAEWAGELGRLGINQGDRVALKYPNETGTLFLDLALIMRGAHAMALPEDNGQSPQELARLHDLKWVLTAEAQGFPVEAAIGRTSGQARIHGPYPQAERFDADLSLTYVFGSGTMGLAKCIEVVLDNTCDDFEKFFAMFRFTERDNFLLFLPLSVLQQRVIFYCSILRGGTVSLVRPKDVLAGLRKLAPTVFVAPPLFYETVLAKFSAYLRAADALSFGRLSESLDPRNYRGPRAGVLGRLAGFPLRKVFGGRIKFMLVGMAMSKKSTISSFNALGLPLFEAYGLSETGIISMNTFSDNRLGTVGKPIVPESVYIGEEGEIMVRRPDLWSRRYTNVPPEVNAESYHGEGLYATGDLGEFDRDGFLRIKGRIKTAIALSSGYKVQPEPIEAQINGLAGVGNSVLLGNGYPLLVLIVSLSEDSPSVREAVRSKIAEINAKAVERGRVNEILFDTTPFTVANRMLNRSLKVSRSEVESHYRARIDQVLSRSTVAFSV